MIWEFARNRSSEATFRFRPFRPLGAGSGGAEKQLSAICERDISAISLQRSVLGPKPFHENLCSNRKGESFVKPRLNRALGGPPSIIQLSTVPSGFFTSMWFHVWGLIHSIFVTVPFNVIGLVASNSAANA